MDDLIEDDEEIEIDLRPAPEVAARLILIAALCRRAFIESSPSDLPAEESAAERFDLARWLADEGLLDGATSAERRLLAAPDGSWTPVEIAEATWQGEGLLALGWALGMTKQVPPYDAPADVGSLLPRIPAPWSSTTAFRRDATLRPEPDIAQERERAELWHWRSETAALLATAPRRERADVEAAIREVAAEARSAGLLASLLAADFAVRGQPYTSLTPNIADELGIVAFERLRALDWLCGLSTLDTSPTDDGHRS